MAGSHGLECVISVRSPGRGDTSCLAPIEDQESSAAPDGQRRELGRGLSSVLLCQPPFFYGCSPCLWWFQSEGFRGVLGFGSVAGFLRFVTAVVVFQAAYQGTGHGGTSLR